MPSAFFERILTGSAIARRNFGACEWNNRILISGGQSVAGVTLNDVWESFDGVNWNRLATGINSFSARSSHVMIVHNNRIYVIGGYDGSGYLSDVWMSMDGKNWERIVNNAFTARDDHCVFSLGPRLYLTGGDAGGAPFTDVWMSYDGIVWDRIMNNYTRLQRTVAVQAVFNNRMHVISGYDGTNRLDTSTNSVDGINWEITGSSCGLPEYDDGAAEVFDNRIVVSGGYNGSAMSCLYYSEDGEKWILGTANMGFSVYQHKMVALKNPNRLFLLFGYEGQSVLTSVWMSTGNFIS